MGKYCINRNLFSTDIYILDYAVKGRKDIDQLKVVEINNKDLKELILKERAEGREVNLLWKKLRNGQRKSNFQNYIETSRYKEIMKSDNEESEEIKDE